MADVHAEDKETKTLTAKCFCKDVHFSLDIPTSVLPLGVHLCHCRICRRSHGTFCVFHSALPRGVAPAWIAPSSLDKLTRYRHPAAKSDRYFCSTCGCHIGDLSLDGETWVISTSIFDANRDDEPSVWGEKTHIHADRTQPGLLDWLPGGDPDDQILQHRDEEADSTSKLIAECHCGGVSFTISRPTPGMQSNPEYKAWISPVDPTKWMAVMDVCDDCRLQSGAHVIPWTFVPKSCLQPTFPDDLRLGTSKTYTSSTGTLRSFCGTCGAKVAGYFGTDGTRELSNGDRVLDIACGLLRAPDGLLAESWLTWRTGRLAHHPSGLRYDKKFTEELAQGMASWGRKKHGEARDFEVG